MLVDVEKFLKIYLRSFFKHRNIKTLFFFTKEEHVFTKKNGLVLVKAKILLCQMLRRILKTGLNILNIFFLVLS